MPTADLASLPALLAPRPEADVDDELRYAPRAAHGRLRAGGLTADAAQARARRVRRPRGHAPPARRDRPAHGAARGAVPRGGMRCAPTCATRRADCARRPLFSVAVIATLAVGIGAAATMYGMLRHLLVQPPPHVARPSSVRKLYVSVGPAGEERAHLRRDRRSRSTSGCRRGACARRGRRVRARREGRRRPRRRRRLVQRDPGVGGLLAGRRRVAAPRPLPRGRRGASGHRRTGRRVGPRVLAAPFGGDPAIVGRSLAVKGLPIQSSASRHAVSAGSSSRTDLWLPLFALATARAPATWHEFAFVRQPAGRRAARPRCRERARGGGASRRHGGLRRRVPQPPLRRRPRRPSPLVAAPARADRRPRPRHAPHSRGDGGALARRRGRRAARRGVRERGGLLLLRALRRRQRSPCGSPSA